MYINTNTSNMYDGIECSASLIFGIIHNIVKIPVNTITFISLTFGYSILDIISRDIIIVSINIDSKLINEVSINNATIIEDDGIGNPMNNYVGLVCPASSVLYLVNLKIPHATNKNTGININELLVSIYITIAGATPKDTMSASESIVSPKSACIGPSLNFLANIPSTLSNTTASSNSCAESIVFPVKTANIAPSPDNALASDAISAIEIIFNIFVSI